MAKQALSGEAREWLQKYSKNIKLKKELFKKKANKYAKTIDPAQYAFQLALRQKERELRRVQKKAKKLEKSLEKLDANYSLDDIDVSRLPRLSGLRISLLLSVAFTLDWLQFSVAGIDFVKQAAGKYAKSALDWMLSIGAWIPGVNAGVKALEFSIFMANLFFQALVVIIIFFSSRIILSFMWSHMGVGFKERMGAKATKFASVKSLKFFSKWAKLMVKVLEVLPMWFGITFETLIQIWIVRKVDKLALLKSKEQEIINDIQSIQKKKDLITYF